jgi:hypothetical protein
MSVTPNTQQIRWNRKVEDNSTAEHSIPDYESARYVGEFSALNSFSRTKIEIMRANSPTLKRLVAVRSQLDKYANYNRHTLLMNRVSNYSFGATTHNSESDKSTITNACRFVMNRVPADKVTYEKMVTCTGHVKQKCSLEIWLPQIHTDDADINENFNRLMSPQTDVGEEYLPMVSSIAAPSRRPSRERLMPDSINNNTRDFHNETLSKRSESRVASCVYHHEQSQIGHSQVYTQAGINRDESSDTFTSRHIDHPSPIIHQNNVRIRSGIPTVPITSTNLSDNIRHTNAGYHTSRTSRFNSESIVNEFIRQNPTLIKQRQEAAQTKSQFENSHQEKKDVAYLSKGIDE